MKNFKQLSLNLGNIDLLSELNQLIPNIETNEILLNNPNLEKTHDYRYGNGSLRYGEFKDYGITERMFIHTNDVFKGTGFETLLNLLKEHYTIGRTRLLLLKPRKCYSWHSDPTQRLHYVIKTNDRCRMVIDDEVCFMPQGTFWIANTKKPHTFFNGGHPDDDDIRIHVISALMDYE